MTYGICFALAVSLFIISCILRIRDEKKWSLILLVICGLALRILISLDPYLHLWDECYHALVAKNLLKHPLIPTLYDQNILSYNYKEWYYSHIWLHKPPLPCWVIALSLKFLGINEFAVRIPSIVLSTFSIILTYEIGKYLLDKKIGWMAAFFHTINGFIIELTGGRIATDHIDVFYLFFIELSIYFAIRQKVSKNINYILPFCISLICAIYCKWLPALIVIPIWIILNFNKDQLGKLVLQLMFIVSLTFLSVAPWQLYIFTNFPLEAKWESEFNWLHITSQLENHINPWYFFILNAMVIWTELFWVIMFSIIVKIVKTKKNDLRISMIVLIIWIFVPYLFFTIVQTKMAGYVVFTGPAIFICIAIFWNDLVLFMNTHLKYRTPVTIFLFILISLSLRYSLERIKPFQENIKETRITESIKNLNKIFGENKIIFFNTTYSVQLMFYTDYLAYDRIPTNLEIQKLISYGYNVKIFNSPEITNVIRSQKDVEIIDNIFF